ncbi:unnamed protein product, partial [Polarella glacialis]
MVWCLTSRRVSPSRILEVSPTRPQVDEQLKRTMERLNLPMVLVPPRLKYKPLTTDFRDKEYYPNIRRCRMIPPLRADHPRCRGKACRAAAVATLTAAAGTSVGRVDATAALLTSRMVPLRFQADGAAISAVASTATQSASSSYSFATSSQSSALPARSLAAASAATVAIVVASHADRQRRWGRRTSVALRQSAGANESAEEMQMARVQAQAEEIRKRVADKVAEKKAKRQLKAAGAASKPAEPAAPWRLTAHPSAPDEWYYYNDETGETCWDPPVAKSDHAVAAWRQVEHATEPGQFYYHNSATGETSWEAPPGFSATDASEEKAGKVEGEVIQEVVDKNVDIKEEIAEANTKEMVKEEGAEQLTTALPVEVEGEVIQEVVDKNVDIKEEIAEKIAETAKLEMKEADEANTKEMVKEEGAEKLTTPLPVEVKGEVIQEVVDKNVDFEQEMADYIAETTKLEMKELDQANTKEMVKEEGAEQLTTALPVEVEGEVLQEVVDKNVDIKEEMTEKIAETAKLEMKEADEANTKEMVKEEGAEQLTTALPVEVKGEVIQEVVDKNVDIKEKIAEETAETAKLEMKGLDEANTKEMVKEEGAEQLTTALPVEAEVAKPARNVGFASRFLRGESPIAPVEE